MNRDLIEKAVVDAIAREMDVSPESIQMSHALREDLEIESLDAMNIIMDLEDKFHVETEIDELLEKRLVNDIVDYLETFLETHSPDSAH